MWKIKLELQNGIVHYLNDVRSGSPGWAECQPSGIKRLEFTFLGRDEKGKDVSYILIMSGMEEYNFFVEAMRGLSGKGKTKITGLWFMGRKPNSDQITGFVLKDKIVSFNTIKGKEYSGMPTMGWKKGITGDKIISVVRRMI